MNLINRIAQKPEYVFRPKQILFRLAYGRTLRKQPTQILRMPWGIPIEINIREVIGKSIYFFGLYDLSLTESVNRIVQKNDIVFDVGANVGYVTGLMSFLAGSKGKVFSFEPNPLILNRLNRNIDLIQRKLSFSNISLHPIGLSDRIGEFILYVPNNFEDNEGIATLETLENAKKIVIRTDVLDNFISDKLVVKLLKVDVEGQEMSVFRGAIKSLEQRRIQNIIFENFSNPEIIDFLIHYGFTVYKINKTFKGVQLSDHNDHKLSISYEADNFLATLFPEEIGKSFIKKSWTIYS